MDEVLSALNTDIEKKCLRCGDLFYHPKTLIEGERQRALEWEDCYKNAKVKIEKLEAENKKIKNELKKWECISNCDSDIYHRVLRDQIARKNEELYLKIRKLETENIKLRSGDV